MENEGWSLEVVNPRHNHPATLAGSQGRGGRGGRGRRGGLASNELGGEEGGEGVNQGGGGEEDNQGDDQEENGQGNNQGGEEWMILKGH